MYPIIERTCKESLSGFRSNRCERIHVRKAAFRLIRIFAYWFPHFVPLFIESWSFYFRHNPHRFFSAWCKPQPLRFETEFHSEKQKISSTNWPILLINMLASINGHYLLIFNPNTHICDNCIIKVDEAFVLLIVFHRTKTSRLRRRK